MLRRERETRSFAVRSIQIFLLNLVDGSAENAPRFSNRRSVRITYYTHTPIREGELDHKVAKIPGRVARRCIPACLLHGFDG